jgi:hypothetical protein
VALYERGLWVLCLPISRASGRSFRRFRRGCQIARSLRAPNPSAVSSLAAVHPAFVTGNDTLQSSSARTPRHWPYPDAASLLSRKYCLRRLPDQQGPTFTSSHWKGADRAPSPVKRAEHQRKGDGRWSSKRDTNGVDATLSLPLYSYAVIHSSKSCPEPQTLI